MNPVPLFLIIVTLPLLLGGCGEKSVNEVKPVEEKQYEVEEEVKPAFKEGLDGLDMSRLSTIGNFFTYPRDAPYTGGAFSLYPHTGQKEYKGSFREGRRDGLHTYWYPNGQKQIEFTFDHGKQLYFKSWNEQGELKTSLNETYFTPVGTANLAELATDNEGRLCYKIDKNPYSGKVYEFHFSGRKERESNYKDGKRYGLDIGWHENGKKQWEANFKDGMKDGLGIWWHKNGQKTTESNWKDGKVVEGSRKYWNSKGEPVDSFEEALQGVPARVIDKVTDVGRVERTRKAIPKKKPKPNNPVP